jgi:DNA-binding beta-propeller fold protein YncE
MSPVFPLRAGRSWVVAALALVGCAATPKPIFEPLDPPLVWPPAPSPARIRYVGALRTSDDLKPPRSAWETLGRILVGPPKPQPLYGPRAVVCTRDGSRVWIADPGGRCLHLFDLDRRHYAQVRRMAQAPLLSPVGLCLGPGDSIFVCDSEQNAIFRLDGRDGRLIDALELPIELQRPAGVYYDDTRGELFVVDVTAHNVKVLDMHGSPVRTIGRRGVSPGEFNFPSAITGRDGLLWIADTGNHRVQALTVMGEPVTMFGRAGDAPGDLALPKGLAMDPYNHLYVVDGRFENVQVFDRTGRLLLFWGEEGGAPGNFWLPAGIFIDGNGRIWVCDTYNRRVQVFDYLEGADDGVE